MNTYGRDLESSLPVGAKAGEWRIERELARGGMGAVYAVVHDSIGKRAALKVVHPARGGLPFPADLMEELAVNEARVVNRIRHPRIVDIFEAGRLPDARPYLVMEQLEGVALDEYVREHKLLPDQAIAILLQLCDALIAAHAAGVVHRDIKLENVFLVGIGAGGGPEVKLLDWGVAKVLDAWPRRRYSTDGLIVGTPRSMPPERARGQAASCASDVYSLGVLAYELFLEQPPFESECSETLMLMHVCMSPPLPSELWPGIPRGLESLLLAMLDKHPDDRPSMPEVARRLACIEAVLASELARDRAMARLCEAPAPAVRLPQPSPVVPRPRPRPPYGRYIAHAVGVLACLLCIALIVAARRCDEAIDQHTPGARASERESTTSDRDRLSRRLPIASGERSR